ncbi:hypothetical protein MKW94_013746 [Papaver nudicaule]|uniref:Uncharacterized protein n=1 Tax=Papaver nudicaule TaxID=74823 RepID=A0AA41V8Y6_PAPNU|nr:hypothetical protein [Papaver nudicaule]
MAKISMFLSFFLFVLIAMPEASSASRMILQKDTCPQIVCIAIVCPPRPPRPCPRIGCTNGSYTPCCGCPTCCPAA